MRMVLTYGDGRTVEALLLAASREHMRVVFAGKSDTIEFLRVGEDWRADSGEMVEIQAMTTITGVSSSQVFEDFAPKAMSAGGYAS